MTPGYWQKPEQTAAAFTDEGYFRTGDIVTIRPDGNLVFHERSKQMLVLSTGKNVAPSPIEAALADSPVIEQALVIGDDRKFVAALIIPDFDGLRQWAGDNEIELPAYAEAICERDAVRDRIQQEIATVNSDLESHEQIGDFRLITEEFTEENDLLTPSLKKKRQAITDRYADHITDIYQEEARDPTPATPE